MSTSVLVEQVKSNIQSRYSWLSSDEVNQAFDLALGDYLRIKYPSDNSRPSETDYTIDFSQSQWLQARMIDLIGRAGGLSVSAYRENGMNWTYASSYIDENLVAQIMPRAGVPR